MTRSPLEQELISSMLDDYVGAWEVERLIRRSRKSVLDEDVRSQSIQIIASLVAEGLIEAGELTTGGGFRPFEGSASDVTRKLSSEWNNLTSDANIGDVAWFRLTPKGRCIDGAAGQGER